MEQVQYIEEPIKEDTLDGCLLVITITIIRVVINNITRCNYILIAVKCLQNGLSVEVILLNIAFNFVQHFDFSFESLVFSKINVKHKIFLLIKTS